jgi:hypothetical protein
MFVFMNVQVITTAPDPNTITWPNLSVIPFELRIRKLIVAGVLVVLFLFWTVPVAFIAAWSNLGMLQSSCMDADYSIHQLHYHKYKDSIMWSM